MAHTNSLIYGTGTTGIAYRRPEYIEALPRWLAVDDTQKGQNRIKLLGETYLPFFGTQLRDRNTFNNTEDFQQHVQNFRALSSEEYVRYQNYLKRAVFYNYISPTVGGLVGLATKEKLVFEASEGLEFAKDNIDGAGTTLGQQLKRTTELVIKHGRAGVLVDFPQTAENPTQEQINNGTARPYATVYTAEQIINWGEKRIGAENKINLIILAEIDWQRAENGYDLEPELRFRVLRLTDGVYTQELRKDNDELIEGPITPTDANGKPLDTIPFQFFGSVNNDAQVDESKMFDMAAINLGHYVNSADYENAAWLTGQPIPWMSGLDESWLNHAMGGVASIGSGALLPVPTGERFGIEQVQPNTMAFEAMGHKENQMVALGAKMVDPNNSFNSATEASINNQSEVSFLQSIKDNVQDGYTQVLEWMAEFAGAELKEFNNPTDFAIIMADPQMLAQVVASWMSGLTSKEDARDYQRKIGVLERTNEEIDELVENDPNGILDGVQTTQQPPAQAANNNDDDDVTNGQ